MDEVEEKLMLTYAKTNDEILKNLQNQYKEQAAERRRYALLQAAATIAAPLPRQKGMNHIQHVVDDAEALLAEIERREK